MKLYLFNPENDIALQHGRRRFTMSPHVARLHDDGALLPLWYASRGDAVIGSCCDREWLDRVRTTFGLSTEIVSEGSGFSGMPWGWSHDAARVLSLAGASVINPESIDRIAWLSHRRTSVAVMERLRRELPFAIPPVPVEVSSVSEVMELSSAAPVYVKAPWSSSGRGVFRMEGPDRRFENRITGILQRQGSVMVEKALDKRRDFAMLFRASGGAVRRVGYSVFFNGIGDTYGGNILADDDTLEDILVADGAECAQLAAVGNLLPLVLSDIVGDAFEGYFGVDMLVATDGMIAPCVEVNLRMTMGVVAHVWRDRYLAPGVNGEFRVMHGMPAATGGTAVVENGRLVSGRVHLTPPSPDGFNFVVDAVKA